MAHNLSSFSASAFVDLYNAFQARCAANTAWYRSKFAREASSDCPSSRESSVSDDDEDDHTSRQHVIARWLHWSRKLEHERNHCSEPATCFHSEKLPGMSLCTFATASAVCSITNSMPCASVIAVVLMARYCATTSIKPTLHMMHRLYAACLYVGIKAHDDRYLGHKLFAKCIGIAVAELSRLELAVVEGVDWRLQVTASDIAALFGSTFAFLAVTSRSAEHVPVNRFAAGGRGDSTDDGVVQQPSAMAVLSWLQQTAAADELVSLAEEPAAGDAFVAPA